MDRLEKAGYGLLALVAGVWILGMVAGMIAIFPFGVIGLALFAGIGLLVAKVVRDRLASEEDDYYDKHVER